MRTYTKSAVNIIHFLNPSKKELSCSSSIEGISNIVNMNCIAVVKSEDNNNSTA